MNFSLTSARHAAMLCAVKFSELTAVVLVAMLADVAIIGGETQATINIKLEGSLTDQDIIIGSKINLTCQATYTPTSSCGAVWYKDSKRLQESMPRPGGRVEWLHGEQAGGAECTATKLMIRNVSSSDTGTYTCVVMDDVLISQPDLEKSMWSTLDVYAVRCYQGYYCPASDDLPRRCPIGTFSPHKNSTSIEDCVSCWSYANERESWMQSMGPNTVALFQTNCYDLKHTIPSLEEGLQQRKSNLSPGAKAAVIVVPVVVVLMFVVGVFYGCYRRRATKYHEKLLSPFKEVDYDPPKLPRSKDVFVCYSSKNRDWVHEVLFPKLKSQDFRVFIDFVDFEIGKTIDDNIVKGIYGSRKTLFILSKDSLKSLYARKELYHALAAGKTGHQVLVILYEKCKAPAEIADLVYLDWTDENRARFWERLYSAIRRPLANEIVNV